MSDPDFQIRAPRPGTKRRIVYDSLDYSVGMTLEELVVECHLEKPQIRSALQGMQEYGLVECVHRHGEALWFLIGATRTNNPITHPPGR